MFGSLIFSRRVVLCATVQPSFLLRMHQDHEPEITLNQRASEEWKVHKFDDEDDDENENDSLFPAFDTCPMPQAASILSLYFL